MDGLRAFCVGAACGLLQAGLVYALGFLYSATAPAYLSVLLAWLLGGALGCWLPPMIGPRWFFVLAALSHWANTYSLLHSGPWGTWLVAGALGGLAGSYWLCHRTRTDLSRILFFESLGTAAGILVTHSLIYPLGLTWVVSLPALATLLTLREGFSVEQNASNRL